MGNGFDMGGMWVFWLLLLAGVVLLVFLAVRAMGGGISRGASASTVQRPTDGPSGRSRAREVLDERYARGELSSEEYRERLQTLGDTA